MGVVNAAEIAHKPVIVFSGVKAHYCYVKGKAQTIDTFLPYYYTYQREIPGEDSAIFLDWPRKFLCKTKDLQENGKYIKLLYDGYKFHVQLQVPTLLKQSRVVFIGLPAHTVTSITALRCISVRKFQVQTAKRIL